MCWGEAQTGSKERSAGGLEATSVNWDEIGGTSNIRVRDPGFTSLVIKRNSKLSG